MTFVHHPILMALCRITGANSVPKIHVYQKFDVCPEDDGCDNYKDLLASAMPAANHSTWFCVVLHGTSSRTEGCRKTSGCQKHVSQHLWILSRELWSQGRQGAAVDELGTVRRIHL